MTLLNIIFENLLNKCINQEIILIHSDITKLLYVNEINLKELFLDFFNKLINNKKTILIPYFNWDFCNKKQYNYLDTKSKVGILSKWCYESNLFTKTNDPIYTFLVAGKNKSMFLKKNYTSAFGKDSIFDIINNNNSLILMINNEHFTMVHYYEELLQVKYRFIKNFNGSVIFNNELINNYDYKMNVRNYDLCSIHDNCFKKYNNFSSFTTETYENNFYIHYIDINQFKKEINESLRYDYLFYIKNKIEVSHKLYSKNLIKTFKDEDQYMFSDISGDYNPLHFDKNLSKDLLYQEWILHGMNGVLTALNLLIQDKDFKFKIFIKKINIIYYKPIFINHIINFEYIFENNKIIIKLLEKNECISDITIEYELEEINNYKLLKYENTLFEVNEPNFIENNKFDEYNESIKIKANIKKLKKYYPYILHYFNLEQIILLISISKNIGMNYPGLNSICMNIFVEFKNKEYNNNIFFKFYNFNNSILTINLESENIDGKIIVNTNRKKKEKKKNIYLLSYKNIDFIKKEFDIIVKNINYKVISCDYNQMDEDIINNQSNLYVNHPEYIFIFNRIEDILKIDIYDIYQDNYDNLFDNYILLISKLRENCKSIIYIFSFHHSITPITQNNTDKLSIDYLINKYNVRLYQLSNELNDIKIINSNIFSNTNKFDYKSYFIGNYIYSYECSKIIANFMLGLIHNHSGNSIRLIILDLDNTLWKGIVGEDGIFGIQIGETYPGNCFTYFQKVLKSLTKMGISLAICSKNDENIVKDLFNERNDMILKYDDFINKKVNWKHKSENIINISKEVGLGLKNILFIDDNPIEREEVKKMLPDINILNIDINYPEQYSNLLLNHNKIVIDKILKEDLKRDENYKKNNEFNKLKINVNNINDFYKSLQSKVYINSLSEKNLDRCESLIQKTNQFNFTTIRLNKNEIIDMNQTNYDFYVIGYENIYFEYENVGVLIYDNINNEIYNYILSCRVIGKGIEEDILIYFIHQLKQKNINKISGKIIHTDRNIPVRNIYSNLGFKEKKNKHELFLLNFNKEIKNSEIYFEKQKNKIYSNKENNINIEKSNNTNKENNINIEKSNNNTNYEKNNKIIDKIYEILKEITKYEPKLDIIINDYEDWDSLKTILFIKKIEQEFNIQIHNDYFQISINKIIELIQN